MPVTYSEQSAGPSTRQANGYPQPESRPTTAAKTSTTMSKAELVELAEERGLPTYGSKKDLISRLSGVEL